jgi:hypothetical protein
MVPSTTPPVNLSALAHKNLYESPAGNYFVSSLFFLPIPPKIKSI